MIPPAAARAVEAAGGWVRWAQAGEVRLRLSSGGPAFAAKGQRRALHDVTATVATSGRRRVELTGAGWPGPLVFADHAARSLEDARRRHRWRLVDVAAFAASALWTYVHVPFVLAVPGAGVDVEELGPWQEAGQTWDRLRVRFPPEVATHSPEQVLYVDGDGLVRRHDYTALAFGRWARAAHYLDGYRDCDGLRVPTRRRVHPRLPSGRALRAVTLVWIDVREVSVGPV